ncbi:MAG: Rrf2 family transcriptional regulator [Bacteroidota bacterium]
MTVIFSKKCEIGLQAVLYLATEGKNKLFNAQQIADKVKQPKEFVSKVLQTLTKSGIVGSKKGKNGGFFLAKKAKKIRLIEIVEVIDGLDVFDNCVLGFSGCSSEEPCPVHDKWGALRDQAYNMLSEETLEELKDLSKVKISSLK